MRTLRKLIIRVDATRSIGTGHLMRCIGLAQAFSRKGRSSHFLVHTDNDKLIQRVRKEGFECTILDKSYPDPDDVEGVIRTAGEARDTWIVLDGYHFREEYQESLKLQGYNLLVIDDMAHLKRYYADVVVNQNVYAKGLRYHVEGDARLLLGCEYGILRSEFLSWKEWERKSPDIARRILVTLGGSDPFNTTRTVIDGIGRTGRSDLEVRVIVGPQNPNRFSIVQTLDKCRFHHEVLQSPEGMDRLIAWADMAVSGGGTTCLEMAYMGLPNLIVILAENQRLVAEGMEEAGCSRNLGRFENLTIEKTAEAMNRILCDKKARDSMREAGRAMVDGRGTDRILNALEERTYTAGGFV
jgi:UDP-2,4-diacetamido-2,4,6-trideoxy-beta-L-altropyranose hydrolase